MPPGQMSPGSSTSCLEDCWFRTKKCQTQHTTCQQNLSFCRNHSHAILCSTLSCCVMRAYQRRRLEAGMFPNILHLDCSSKHRILDNYSSFRPYVFTCTALLLSTRLQGRIYERGRRRAKGINPNSNRKKIRIGKRSTSTRRSKISCN